MTSIYDLFGTNESDSEAGKWFDLGPGIKVKVRRFKSKKSKDVRTALEAPYTRVNKFGTGKLPDDVTDAIVLDHIAQGILVDWSGFTDTKGNALQFNTTNAKQILTLLPELKDTIIEISLGLDNFRDEQKKDVEGN